MSIVPRKFPTCRLLFLAAALLFSANLRAEAAATTLPASPPSEWRYGEVPGFEILSDRSDESTRAYVLRLQRARQLLLHFFPEESASRPEMPVRVLLYRAEQDALSAPPITNPLRAEKNRVPTPQIKGNGGAAPGQVWTSRSRTRADGARVFADDSTTLLSKNLYDEEVNGRPDWSEHTFTAYATHWLQQRTPPPPWWLDCALRELINSTIITAAEIRFSGLSHGSNIPGGPVRPDELLPMQEFLAFDPNKNLALIGSRAAGVVQVQARLFIRWAVLRATPARQAAFNRFISRTMAEPASEEIFADCFGVRFAEVQQELASELTRGNREQLAALRTDGLPAVSTLELHVASAEEFARITGEAARLYAAAPTAPADALEITPEKLRADALTVLRAAFDTGASDPRLLADLALTHLDLGESTQARPFLEAAVKFHVLNPRVYFELARLRFESARAASRPLSPAERAGVMDLVKTGCEQDPVSPKLYALAVKVCAESTPPLDAEAFALLIEAVHRFPQELALAYDIARILAQSARKTDAQQIVAHALARDFYRRDSRQRWEALQSELAAQP
jgi:hypothetical protein